VAGAAGCGAPTTAGPGWAAPILAGGGCTDGGAFCPQPASSEAASSAASALREDRRDLMESPFLFCGVPEEGPLSVREWIIPDELANSMPPAASEKG
jgi:hypothetical protein